MAEYLQILNNYKNNGLLEIEIAMIAPSGGGTWYLCWKDTDFSLNERERVFASWSTKEALKAFDWSSQNDKYFRVQKINPLYLKRRIRKFLRKGYDK